METLKYWLLIGRINLISINGPSFTVCSQPFWQKIDTRLHCQCAKTTCTQYIWQWDLGQGVQQRAMLAAPSCLYTPIHLWCSTRPGGWVNTWLGCKDWNWKGFLWFSHFLSLAICSALVWGLEFAQDTDSCPASHSDMWHTPTNPILFVQVQVLGAPTLKNSIQRPRRRPKECDRWLWNPFLISTAGWQRVKGFWWRGRTPLC